MYLSIIGSISLVKINSLSKCSMPRSLTKQDELSLKSHGKLQAHLSETASKSASLHGSLAAMKNLRAGPEKKLSDFSQL
jgi:hypothetical protein